MHQKSLKGLIYHGTRALFYICFSVKSLSSEKYESKGRSKGMILRLVCRNLYAVAKSLSAILCLYPRSHTVDDYDRRDFCNLRKLSRSEEIVPVL